MTFLGSWADEARCVGMLHLFYPAEHQSLWAHTEAIAICKTCPVIEECREHALHAGEVFGVWGGLFSVFDCSLAHFRKTEDAWNAIISGGLTGGTLAARAGGKAIARNAAGGVVILALIEGVMMLVNKFITKVSMGPQGGAAFVDRLEPPVDPPGTEDYDAGSSHRHGAGGGGRLGADANLMLR